MQPRTFRARLTLATTLIVTVAVVLLGTVAFATVRLTLDATRQNRLATTALAIRSVIDVRHDELQPLDREDHEQFLALLGERTNGAVLGADGHLIVSNLAAPPPAVLAAIRRGGTRGNVQLEGGTIVYEVVPISADGVVYGSAAAWESRRANDEAISATVTALGIAGVLVIAAAAAAGGTLSRRMLQPVSDLSAMLSEIEATDLTERLHWSGPDDELGRLCRTFDRLLDRLSAVVDNERRLIADASHELRTPLSVMRAEVELALSHDRSPEQYRIALQRLQRETHRLELLAEGLLASARERAAALDLVSVEPAVAAARAVHRMQALAQTQGVRIVLDAATSCTVLGEASALERAIVALIDNALQFTAAAGTVAVSATDEAGIATICVRDDGPGFSAAALRDATARFWRDDQARTGSGTGLGLAIVRATIERFSGTITLCNAPDRGAIVRIALPIVRSPEALDAAP